ncbi:arsenate-mycothiol transferase ArsC [Halosimplex salinum]|uniref:arsenate-mycothiol transferase ArsC n=1 Tax=Halosimplex salinum TaxID=1710538 RepID=UPI000F46B5AE|nr:ArsC family transcriptional regulator [Halosimplex salinum]
MSDDRPAGAAPDDPVRVALICVQNAGRSQMATAFAERERERRGLEDRVEIVTGGTDPADSVHGVVVDAMAEVDIDISDREPRGVTTDELAACDYVATMGCSTLELDPASGVDVRDWALPDPHGQDLEAVREIRETVAENVVALFDEFSERASTEE